MKSALGRWATGLLVATLMLSLDPPAVVLYLDAEERAAAPSHVDFWHTRLLH
jgi:hypothetical protein